MDEAVRASARASVTYIRNVTQLLVTDVRIKSECKICRSLTAVIIERKKNVRRDLRKIP